MESTEIITTAARFVNSTNANIFLTGKAGTGKTTFLRDIAKKTHKRFVIVAPTGIAALNAKGVTIHSQFLLPFGTFIPVKDPSGQISDTGQFYTQNTLIRKQPLNAARKNVLRDIDLLIIDEVSMLRSDVLDAIDARLRYAKRAYNRPFGGVQLLMIGDLFQLPPIVKNHEWGVMKQYYQSAWFFDALALKEAGFVHIELDKIFRQSDEQFIELLNHLRNDVATEKDIDLLNSHFVPEHERSSDGAIVLTTHNNRADRINTEALNALEGSTISFSAVVEDDFPESIYPVKQSIELKKGTRIMFIKNDSNTGLFYNGKLATVNSLDNSSISVIADDEDEPFEVPKVTWENRKYVVNEATKELEEEVIGTFTHYPIKLAWAITVHKSQGLTFDKAIIDVGQAFAPGQVYVALSRLRSLDGLILGTQISARAISTDAEVAAFSKKQIDQQPLAVTLETAQSVYLKDILRTTFDYASIIDQLRYFQNKKSGKLEFEDAGMREAIPQLITKFESQSEYATKFEHQLTSLLDQKDHAKLIERLEKGRDYFTQQLWAALKDLLTHAAQVRQLTRTKTYINGLMEIDLLILHKLVDAHQSVSITKQILAEEEVRKDDTLKNLLQGERKKLLEDIEEKLGQNPVKSTTKTGRRRKKEGTKKPKAKKGATFTTTLELLEQGLTIQDIAGKREMATSTIEGHVARLISEGKLEIDRFIPAEDRKTIAKALASNGDKGIKAVVTDLNGEYTFGEVRMVQALLERFK